MEETCEDSTDEHSSSLENSQSPELSRCRSSAVCELRGPLPKKQAAVGISLAV